MVMAGADGYFWVFTAVLVDAGRPASTAALFASDCSAASCALVAVVEVVVADFEPLLPAETAKAMPTMAAATTTRMITLRTCLRRFWRCASSASLASLAARWRALFSLGTGADPSERLAAPPVGRWAPVPVSTLVGCHSSCRSSGGPRSAAA